MRALPQQLPAILAGLAGLVAAHLALSAVGSSTTVDDGASVAGDTLHLVLPGGQNDRLELSMLDADHLGIAYAGTSVPAAGEDCRQVAPRLIGCAADGLDRVLIETGDGDDVVDTSRISYDTEIDTADVLIGNEGANVFVGHGGADVIDGNGGFDVVVPDTRLSP